MSNIHGLNQNNQNSRYQQLNNNRNSGFEMLGITEQDLQLMSSELSQNRIPFINIMSESSSPLEESIPSTLKLVWCPSFTLLSFSTIFLLTMWVMYIVCLSEGIDTGYYEILAPSLESLRKYGAFNYQLLHDGEVWRLIAAIFLNGDILQIVMSSFYVLFLLPQLEQCSNPISIFVVVILGSISSNITWAVFADMVSLNFGAGPLLYSVLGCFYAYITINSQPLFLIRTPIICMVSMFTFFAFLFSIGTYGFSSFCGGILGGYCSGLIVLAGIKPKGMILPILGAVGLIGYWLMMFLIFYLAT